MSSLRGDTILSQICERHLVKGWRATHEREALENVTKARAMAMGAQNIEEKGKAENALLLEL